MFRRAICRIAVHGQYTRSPRGRERFSGGPRVIRRHMRACRPNPATLANGRAAMNRTGLLIIDKPSGPTSRDVVNRVKRLVRPAKCGHAGTLDPLASGVVVVCVGSATRLIQYVQRMPKCYHGTFLLGRSSPTDDIEQEPTLLADAPLPSREEIDSTLPRFLGEIEQRPPLYSAVKIAGKRSYELARRGKAVELAARTVSIYELELLRYEYPELELAIRCGSGTYVRSLGRDLARALGTEAVMSALVRGAIGSFLLDGAVRYDDLTSEEIDRRLRPPFDAVAELPRVVLSEAEMENLAYGRPISRPSSSGTTLEPSAEWAAIDHSGNLAAILYEKRPGELWPRHNFVGK